MSKTSKDKIDPEEEYKGGDYLPRAEDWGSNSNSHAFGFDAINSFNKISHQHSQIPEIQLDYSQTLTDRDNFRFPTSVTPESSNSLPHGHNSQESDSYSENSSTMLLLSRNFDSQLVPPHRYQGNSVTESYGSRHEASNSQEMVQETQKQASMFPQPIINIGEILDLCNFAEIHSDLLVNAYTRLRTTCNPQDSLIYIGDWLNANEIKSTTLAKVLLKFAETVKGTYGLQPGLKSDYDKLHNLYTSSHRLLEGNQEIIASLEKEVKGFKSLAEELRYAQNVSNDFTVDLKLQTAFEIDALRRQIKERTDEIDQNVQTSLARQREAVDDAIRMAEFKRAQEVEYRSQTEQQRINDWNNIIAEIKHFQEAEACSNREKIEDITGRLSEATSLLRRAVEKSEESHTEMRRIIAEESASFLTMQRLSSDELELLKSRVERLESEIPLSYPASNSSDIDDVLERRGLHRIGEELIDLTLRVNSCLSDLGGFKRETYQCIRELSGSVEVIQHESFAAPQWSKINTLISSLESRLMALEQRAGPHTTASDTQSQGEKVVKDAQVAETAEPKEKVNEPLRRRRGRPPKTEKTSTPRDKARAATELQPRQSDRSKNFKEKTNKLDRWITQGKGKISVRTNHTVEHPQDSSTPKPLNADLTSKACCDCTKQGCKHCSDLTQRIERLEAELLAVKERHEDLKELIPSRAEITREIKDGLEFLGTTQGTTTHIPSQLVDKNPVLNSSQLPEASRGRTKTVTDPKNENPKLRASSKEFISNNHIQPRIPETNDVAVRGIHRSKYSSTCYINAAVQALFKVQEFSDFLKNNQFDKSHHPLLAQLQRLYLHCRLSSGQKSTNANISNNVLVDCLNLKKMKLAPERQEDSIEFLENLVEVISDEMRKSSGLQRMPSLRALLKADLVCAVSCRECGNGDVIDHAYITVHLENSKVHRTDTTIASKVFELLQEKDKTTRCSVCQRETRSRSTFNYGFSKYLCLKVARNAWNAKKNKMERVGQKIRPDKSLEIKLDHQRIKARYELIGGIIHKGSANSGHYLNVMKISHKWYELDDAKVTVISDSEATQQLESSGVLIMYREEENQRKEQNLPTKESRTKESERNTKQRAVKTQNQNGGYINKKNEKKVTHTDNRRRHPHRHSKKRNYFRPRRVRYKKIYIKKPENGFHDPDRKCFYVPKT